MAMHIAFSTLFRFRKSLALAVALVLAAPTASAQAPSIMAAGDTIVSGFSGTVASPPPAGGNPADETFIDLEGASVRIQRPQPAGPPAGQLIPSPTVFSAKAREVGQVFAITTDDAPAPNIYVGATSAYDVQIVVPDNDGDGRPERVKTGQPGAGFMAGQWGPGGTGGSIYRIDGTTGAISLFTTIGANTGPGLGDIVFDPASRQFFVSDLDNGLIYRLDATGAIVDTYDHGTVGRPATGLPAIADDGSAMTITAPAFNAEDPATWAYTPSQRMVWGLAVFGGRLYYAATEGPRIFSVGLKVDGSFANDTRSEIDLAGLPNITASPVSDIVFDAQGRMILAQRGKQRASYDYTVFAEPLQAGVLRLRREVPDDPATPGLWVPVPETYAIGFRPEGRNATGGIALGYGYTEAGQLRPGSCSEYLWSTGESLRDNPALAARLGQPATVHGLQGNGIELVRPQNDPPFNAYFTDYDDLFADPERQGHMGDVEIWQPCRPGQTSGYYPPYLPPYIPPYFPPPGYTPPGGFNLSLDKYASYRDCVLGGIGWRCFFTIRITNSGGTPYWGPITVEDWLPANPPGAVMYFAPTPPWFCSPTGPSTHQCLYPPTYLSPGDSVDLHVTVEVPRRRDLCRLVNGARIDWPFGAGDANPADDADFASARIPEAGCRPPEGERTNLRIEKQARQYCGERETNYVCGFLITVTNTGPGVYNGNIVVTDTLSVPNNVVANFPWNCTNPGPVHTCTYPGAALNPGDSVNLLMQVAIPKGQARELRICQVRNRAQITFAPGGSAQNTNAADDTSATVMSQISGEHCLPTRQRSDLTISKKFEGCVPRGQPGTPSTAVIPSAGFVCVFSIKVKNLGPDAFAGPLTINDTIAGLPPGPPAIFAPPVCVPDGSGGFNCSAPWFVLASGAETPPLWMGVAVPGNGEVCRIVNTAKIVNPPGGSASNFNGGNDQADAVGIIPLERCQPQLMISPVNACPVERQMPNSQCCPEGQRWNGRACVPSGTPPQTCPPGTTGVPPNCRPIVLACPEGSVGTPPNCRCPAGMVGTPPNCRSPQCPQGTTGTPPNCRPIVQLCPPGTVGIFPNCRCPEGMIGTPGNCRPPPQCPAGSVGTPPNCRCAPGTTGTPGNCRPLTCPQGMIGTPPNCRPIVQLCPPGSVGTPPNCRCPAGTTGTPGNCQPLRCPQGMVGTPPNCRPIVQLCPPGSVGTPPNCRCPAGTTGTPGNCQPAKCPQGMVGTPPNCRTIPVICPRGTVGTPPNCRPIVLTCPAGSVGTPPNCRCPAGTIGTPPNCQAVPR